jgi:hypothetical protein
MTQMALVVPRGAGGRVTASDVAEAIECLRCVIRAQSLRGAGMRLLAVRTILEHWRWQEEQDPVRLLVEILGSRELAYTWMEGKLRERDALALEAKSDE